MHTAAARRCGLTHPINMLFEMLSKCPLYFSHTPAGLMWSVVHLPLIWIHSAHTAMSVYMTVQSLLLTRYNSTSTNMSFKLQRTLIKTVKSSKSLPSHALNGSSSCKRSLVGDTSTLTLLPSAGGAWNVSSPGSKPFDGSSSPNGAFSLNFSPGVERTVTWS